MEIDAANVSLRGVDAVNDVVISFKIKNFPPLQKEAILPPFVKGGLKGDLAGFAAEINPPALRATSLKKGGDFAPFVKGGLKGDLAGYAADINPPALRATSLKKGGFVAPFPYPISND